jgi:hypothetical protein
VLLKEELLFMLLDRAGPEDPSLGFLDPDVVDAGLSSTH